MRFYIWFILSVGSAVILAMLGFLMSDLFKSHKKEDIEAFLAIAAAGSAWIIIFFYFIFNSPKSVVLNDRVMQVNWKSGKKEYLWQDVSLKKAGLHNFVLIIVHDPVWFIPRWVLLDGSSKQYKELISKIKKIKHLTEIERL